MIAYNIKTGKLNKTPTKYKMLVLVFLFILCVCSWDMYDLMPEIVSHLLIDFEKIIKSNSCIKNDKEVPKIIEV